MTARTGIAPTTARLASPRRRSARFLGGALTSLGALTAAACVNRRRARRGSPALRIRKRRSRWAASCPTQPHGSDTYPV